MLFRSLEFEKQRLGSIRPLEEMVVKSDEGPSKLHGKKQQWKELCETRFGLTVSRAVLQS